MIIVDETMAGERIHSFTLESISEQMTVREIIRARIWQEVHEYNSAKRASAFLGFVQPVGDEQRLRSPSKTSFSPVNWEAQFETALTAFQSNGYFIIIGNRQAENLDDTYLVEAETEVSFIKFIPLVGG